MTRAAASSVVLASKISDVLRSVSGPAFDTISWSSLSSLRRIADVTKYLAFLSVSDNILLSLPVQHRISGAFVLQK